MPDTLTLPKARIATADMFVKCPDRSTYLRDTLKADLVDMETAALARMAKLLNIPWAGIKATTDNANGDSSGDFHANLEAAAKRVVDAAAQFIAVIQTFSFRKCGISHLKNIPLSSLTLSKLS
ncbi:MAG: hypothetical protein ABJP02_02890 [Parasphingorhabdus sp.]|uniref:phosphorylase family protein n=1 Tax=Parasphingorhabdus sp. TaxID=2709688 RepID=UPI00329742D1